MPVTYTVEGLSRNGPELMPLFREHHEELSGYKQRGFDLHPNWDRYKEYEYRGLLQSIIAREDGKIIGYFVFIGPMEHMHVKALFAQGDMFFVTKQRRGKGYGRALFNRAASRAREIGCSFWQYSENPLCRIPWLRTKRNAVLKERIYLEFLG